MQRQWECFLSPGLESIAKKSQLSEAVRIALDMNMLNRAGEECFCVTWTLSRKEVDMGFYGFGYAVSEGEVQTGMETCNGRKNTDYSRWNPCS